MRNRNIICYIICLLSLTACVIEDDIPYPLLEGAILSMTVEGQRAGEEGQSVEATIDAKARTVTLFVNDSVDLSRLKIKSLKVTEGATLMADSAACADILRFRCEYAGGFYQAGFLYGENVSGICLEGVGDAIDQTRSGRDGASGGCRDRSGEP